MVKANEQNGMSTFTKGIKNRRTLDKEEFTYLTDSIWNFAPKHSLVIVTANSPYEPGQRVDIEILDTEHGGNVYLSKKVSHFCPIAKIKS